MTDERRARLAAASLYLVCDAIPQERLVAALRGGVQIVQLRAKAADDEQIRAAATRFKQACQQHGALLIVNDRPDLAVELGADGVHVGQDDVPVAEARRIVGPERLVGLSTHDPEQVRAAQDSGADYIGVGPVNATPTKPGRPAVGTELVAYAAAHSRLPFFAIGGVDERNVALVRAAGAGRIAVVRAIAEAEDPERAARALRAAIEAGVRADAA